jgi:hypothetical protein
MANGQNETQPAKIVQTGRLRSKPSQVRPRGPLPSIDRLSLAIFVVAALSGREGRIVRAWYLASCCPTGDQPSTDSGLDSAYFVA